MRSILDKYRDADLREFAQLCKQVVRVDEQNIFRAGIEAVKYYRNPLQPTRASILQQQNRWLKSLRQGKPDYSLYNHPLILPDLWACWVVYSRKYLLALKSPKSLGGHSIRQDVGKIRSVVDVGCGIGYSTAGLKYLFPKAEVFGTNLADTCQFEIATLIGGAYDFSVKENVAEVGRVDLVFASEYFEHFPRPIEHLLEILRTCQPKFLIIANAFAAVSLGHFPYYQDDGNSFAGKLMGRRFNKALRDRGFRNVDTNCWNQRPAYWRREL
jgi:SAM-dependent methyltransferase